MASSFKGGFLRDDTTGALVVSGSSGASTLGSIATIHKMVGQTFDIALPAVGSVAPTGGTRYWTKIPVLNPGVANSIIFELGTAGVDGAAVLANCFFGLHRGSDGQLIGTTGDITATLKGAPGSKQPAISSVGGLSLDISAERFLYVQHVIGTQSSTAAALVRASNVTGRANAGLTAPDFAYGSGAGGQSSLGANISTEGAITQLGVAWWLAVGVA
jgi:hypothetical protein